MGESPDVKPPVTLSPEVITPQELRQRIGTADAPLVLDVRREAVFAAEDTVIPSADWHDHRQIADLTARLPTDREVVVYCVHGHQVSVTAVALLRAAGVRVRKLDGGIEAYRDAGGSLAKRTGLPDRTWGRATVWVTRQRPDRDGLACCWLIRRFVDPAAEIHFVEPDWVALTAIELDAVPFGPPGEEALTDPGFATFGAFLGTFALNDPALQRLAAILSAATRDHGGRPPESAGLRAVLQGLAETEPDDLVLLDKALTVIDGLYAWCRAIAIGRDAAGGDA